MKDQAITSADLVTVISSAGSDSLFLDLAVIGVPGNPQQRREFVTTQTLATRQVIVIAPYDRIENMCLKKKKKKKTIHTHVSVVPDKDPIRKLQFPMFVEVHSNVYSSDAL